MSGISSLSRYTTAEQRFLLQADFGGDETECVEWMGNKTVAGYGTLGIGNCKTDYAHRFSYKYFVGDIPYRMTIDHLCMNRACVNPTHLEVVTREENSRREGLHRTRALPAHGTVSRYSRKHKCRCDACRQAKADQYTRLKNARMVREG